MYFWCVGHLACGWGGGGCRKFDDKLCEGVFKYFELISLDTYLFLIRFGLSEMFSGFFAETLLHHDDMIIIIIIEGASSRSSSTFHTTAGIVYSK